MYTKVSSRTSSFKNPHFRSNSRSSTISEPSAKKARMMPVGMWYAHFSGQWIARQIVHYAGSKPQLLVAGKILGISCDHGNRQNVFFRAYATVFDSNQPSFRAVSDITAILPKFVGTDFLTLSWKFSLARTENLPSGNLNGLGRDDLNMYERSLDESGLAREKVLLYTPVCREMKYCVDFVTQNQNTLPSNVYYFLFVNSFSTKLCLFRARRCWEKTSRLSGRSTAS